MVVYNSYAISSRNRLWWWWKENRLSCHQAKMLPDLLQTPTCTAYSYLMKELPPWEALHFEILSCLQSTRPCQKSRHCLLLEYSMLHRMGGTSWLGSTSLRFQRETHWPILNSWWLLLAHLREGSVLGVLLKGRGASWGKISGRGSEFVSRCGSEEVVRFSSSSCHRGAGLHGRERTFKEEEMLFVGPSAVGFGGGIGEFLHFWIFGSLNGLY